MGQIDCVTVLDPCNYSIIEPFINWHFCISIYAFIGISLCTGFKVPNCSSKVVRCYCKCDFYWVCVAVRCAGTLCCGLSILVELYIHCELENTLILFKAKITENMKTTAVML